MENTLTKPPENNLVKSFNKMAAIPGGKLIFTKAVCMKAPYFSTIKPKVVELKHNACRIEMPMRRGVQNHIRTVHAIAMCNLVELTMGLVAEASVPSHLRWLPKGMDVEYVAKAQTDLYAVSKLSDDVWDSAPNVPVTVNVYDQTDQLVTRATVNLWVTEKRK